MIKRIFTHLSLVALLLTASGMALATEGSGSSGYNDPQLYEAFNFTAVLNGDQVDMTWDVYAPAGFNYYKVVRSTTNNNPVYPEDGYILASGDPSLSSYTDHSPETGTAYYRVCSIASPNRYCSSVVTITYAGDGGGTTTKEETEVSLEEADIELAANFDDGVQLAWEVTGETPYGFKLARSYTHENPTYPTMSGDTAQYLSNSDQRSYTDKKVTAGKTAHYRICQYTGAGGCLSYSNSVSVQVPSDYEDSYTEKTYEVSKPDTSDAEYEAIRAELAALKAEMAQLRQAFYDIQQHQYAIAIDYLREKGIVQGYNDGTYKPDNQINRAEFMKIVVGEKYDDELTETLADCFEDVEKEWFAPYVCLGKQKGIVHGYGDGGFKPGQNISFVEAAKILANVYGLALGEDGVNWYEAYVRALQEEGYIPASIGELAKPITRGEMAELIWRIKEAKHNQDSAELLSEPIKINEGDYAGWQVYSGSDFSFYHPGWYQGQKWGWDILSEEKDYIDNLSTPNYMDVDTYMAVYDVSGTNLATNVWFEHPLVSSTELTVNGVTALKRHFRAPRGTVVNGRTTGENENITVYSYLVNGRVVVLQYFNAHGTENKDVEIFEKIASSFQVK